jgi:hypothetical protein
MFQDAYGVGGVGLGGANESRAAATAAGAALVGPQNISATVGVHGF